MQTTVVPVFGILLGDLLIHCLDIASATRRPWTISPTDAWPVMCTMPDVAPGWVRDDVHRAKLTERSSCAGANPHSPAFTFDHGELTFSTTAPDDGAVDIIVHDPGRLILEFPYGRARPSHAAVARLAARLQTA